MDQSNGELYTCKFNSDTARTRHSDIGPSAYFAKLGKKKVNEEKEVKKHRK